MELRYEQERQSSAFQAQIANLMAANSSAVRSQAEWGEFDVGSQMSADFSSMEDYSMDREVAVQRLNDHLEATALNEIYDAACTREKEEVVRQVEEAARDAEAACALEHLRLEEEAIAQRFDEVLQSIREGSPRDDSADETLTRSMHSTRMRSPGPEVTAKGAEATTMSHDDELRGADVAVFEVIPTSEKAVVVVAADVGATMPTAVVTPEAKEQSVAAITARESPLRASLHALQPVSAVKFGLKHFLEVDGLDPVAAIGADWNPKPAAADDSLPSASYRVEDWSICPRASVVFDPSNAAGAAPWGDSARGSIVVAMRGHVLFETLALHAEMAGAAALVIIDNDDEDSKGWAKKRTVPPKTPTVIVPSSLRAALCERQGSSAAIVCRRSIWAAPTRTGSEDPAPPSPRRR